MSGYDPDIGKCDDCGSEEVRRVPVGRVITIDGEPTVAVAWLCFPCQCRTGEWSRYRSGHPRSVS